MKLYKSACFYSLGYFNYKMDYHCKLLFADFLKFMGKAAMWWLMLGVDLIELRYTQRPGKTYLGFVCGGVSKEG